MSENFKMLVVGVIGMCFIFTCLTIYKLFELYIGAVC